jgi:hypothetical membrane protein
MSASSGPGRAASSRPFLPVLAGLLGLLAIGVALIVPAAVYVGRAGESYSPLNHFISELGEVGVSQLAWMFNAGMVVSGVLLGLLLAVIGWRLDSGRARVAGVFGILAGLGVVGVGLTPMNDLVPHLGWAFVFFWGGMIALVLLTSAIWRDRGRHLPRWLAGVGFASAAVFVVFLVHPFVVGPPDRRMLDPASGIARPAVWDHAVLEWLVLLAVLGFAGSGAVAAGGSRPKKPVHGA